MWDALSGAEVNTLSGPSDRVYSVSYGADGTRIVSRSGDKTIKVWDAISGAEVSTLSGHSVGISSVSYNPDGTHIVLGSHDKTIKVWVQLRLQWLTNQPNQFINLLRRTISKFVEKIVETNF